MGNEQILVSPHIPVPEDLTLDQVRQALYRIGKRLFQYDWNDLDSAERTPLHLEKNHGLSYHDLYDCTTTWYIEKETIEVRDNSGSWDSTKNRQKLLCSLATCETCARGLYEAFLPEAVDGVFQDVARDLLKMLTIEKLKEEGILP